MLISSWDLARAPTPDARLISTPRSSKHSRNLWNSGKRPAAKRGFGRSISNWSAHWVSWRDGFLQAVVMYPASPICATSATTMRSSILLPVRTKRLFVEFTYAKDGHEEHLRMKVLNDRGHANLLAPIMSSGTANSGPRIELPAEVEPVHKSANWTSAATDALQPGSKKGRREYGRMTGFVADYADQLASADPVFTLLRSLIENAVDLSTLDFKSVYLLYPGASTMGPPVAPMTDLSFAAPVLRLRSRFACLASTRPTGCMAARGARCLHAARW